MSITERYGFKIKYDQFGDTVPDYYYDVSETVLIEEFEKCVLDLNNLNKEQYSMLELGSNQAYYSMLFKSILKGKQVLNLMVEPTDYYIERGKYNFHINNYEGVFINKSIGDIWVAHNSKIEKDQTSVDSILEEYSLDTLDVLHSDIDGAEITMLQGATESLKNKKIEYAFILTHGLQVHQTCLDFISDFDYEIIMNETKNTVGADTLLIIKRK